MAIHPQSHVICITGGKGGVGKSIYAANLAAALMREAKSPTLLIDADANSCGDQNIILGLRPSKTLAEVAQFTGSVSQQSLSQLVTKHASGMGYIGAVHNPELRLDADPMEVVKQLESLSQFFRMIICDLGSELKALQMGLIDISSALMVVTTAEVLAVNQTKRLLNDLASQTVPTELFQIVVNRYAKTNLAPQAISQTLQRPILSILPQDDITAINSIQRNMPFVLSTPNAPLSRGYFDMARQLTTGTLQKLKVLSQKRQRPQPSSGSKDSPQVSSSDVKNTSSRNLLKLRIHAELIDAMDLRKGIADTKGDPNKEKQLWKTTQMEISKIVDKQAQGVSRDERAKIIKEVLDEALALGPLEDLLKDPTVTEIMVNGHEKIFIEKSGRVTQSPITFTSNLQLLNVIKRIIDPLGRQINEQTPYQDARLKDGSRVNAVIGPLAIDGPALTIRKFSKDAIQPEDYYKWGSISPQMMEFLRICVENGMNVVISGGTGSGKTTLLNVLSGFIPTNERIITIEDAAELQLKQEHVVRLETKPSNSDGKYGVSIRDLIRNALRMRPDRIVVGECRDGAALDMLQAMNTGHDGSMTTVHSNSPKDAITRLETLCLMAGMEMPIQAIRKQIAGAVNLIVQISRLADGSRKVKSISEVIGMTGDVLTQQEIFTFKEVTFDKNRRIVGEFRAMGNVPKILEDLEKRNIKIPRNLFSNQPTPKHEAAVAARPKMRPAKPLKKTGGS